MWLVFSVSLLSNSSSSSLAYGDGNFTFLPHTNSAFTKSAYMHTNLKFQNEYTHKKCVYIHKSQGSVSLIGLLVIGSVKKMLIIF